MQTQPQTVVVMQPMQAQTHFSPSAGETHGLTGTAQPVQQVVVIQQPVQQVVVGSEGNRYPRWAYLLFSIGMWCYHFILSWALLMAAFTSSAVGADGYGVLFFFCGALPSFITWVWLINDSTVYCANPGTGMITKVCCCSCVNGYLMALPIGIAAGLRVVFWISIFGIMADILCREENTGCDSAADNYFFFVLSLGCFDVGPLILLAVDWWWYYSKFDWNGLFGTKLQPLRCVTGESLVVFIISWAFIGMFEELVDDAAKWIWPWILHGVLSTAILIFAAFLQFSGTMTGNVVSNGFFRFVAIGFGIAQAVLTVIIYGYLFDFAFDENVNQGEWFIVVLLLIYILYYSGMTIPCIWALLSFQTAQSQGAQSVV